MEEKKDLENNENLLDEKLNEEDINNDVEVLQLNDVNFPLKFLETYNSIIEDTKNKSGLFIHQRMIKEYIKQPNVRGLMIYHELGTGKTLTAISAAIELDRPTIIMCASSIKYNFIKEYGKIKGYLQNKLDVSNEELEEIEKEMKKKFAFSTINAFNKYDQLVRASYALSENYTGENLLEGKTLIVDEAHKLFSFIVSEGATLGRQIYDLINSTKDIKILFLSGTPIVNNIFEMVPMSNMISNLKPAFPESYKQFKILFIENNDIKNINIFKERLIGLISYVPIKRDNSEINDYPKNLGIEIKMLPLSQHQFNVYVAERLNEISKKLESLAKRRGKIRNKIELDQMQIKNDNQLSSYMVRSRKALNYVFPEKYILMMKEDEKLTEEKINELISDKEFLKSFGDCSVKFKVIFDFIMSEKKDKHLVYSSFLHNGGVYTMTKFMNLNGWQKFNYQNPTKVIKGKTYCVWSGENVKEEQQLIRKIFNAVENLHGDLIRVIFITAAGTEGINLEAVRHVHIIEPYWNTTRINQIIGRAIRYKSHVLLPKSEQNVKTTIYIGIPPKDLELNDYLPEDKLTMDEELLVISERKSKLVDKTLNLFKEISIDCSFNRKKNDKYECFICTPIEDKILNYNIIQEQFLPGNDNCVIPYSLEKKLMKHIKNNIYKFKNELYLELPFITPSRFIKIKHLPKN